MKIIMKNGKEKEVKDDWIVEWCSLYWGDDVSINLQKARLWCLSNPEKRKVKLRSFLNNWLSRDCRIKPVATQIVAPQPVKQETTLENRQSYLEKMRGMI